MINQIITLETMNTGQHIIDAPQAFLNQMVYQPRNMINLCYVIAKLGSFNLPYNILIDTFDPTGTTIGEAFALTPERYDKVEFYYVDTITGAICPCKGWIKAKMTPAVCSTYNHWEQARKQVTGIWTTQIPFPNGKPVYSGGSILETMYLKGAFRSFVHKAKWMEVIQETVKKK